MWGGQGLKLAPAGSVGDGIIINILNQEAVKESLITPRSRESCQGMEGVG